jgi:transglutaminase-like putative cysteine protease
MKIDRRDFLKASATFSMATFLPRTAEAHSGLAPQSGAWRRFKVVTRLEIAEPAGKTQAWIPLPSVNEAEWFRSEGSEWTGNTASARLVRDPKYGAEMLHVEWSDGEGTPFVEVVSHIATRDRAVDFDKPGDPPPLSDAQRAFYTAGTELIPVDGIVKETAQKITRGADTDLARARAIYEWVVDNTFRDAKTRGCGVGDIAAMLTTGIHGGKCADINALYVGLARAAGLPARDIYGVRVAPSSFGYASLGPKNDVITKAQHCRAEVYLEGYGWVPVDPADVRKVVLEEPPGNLSLDDAKVVDARKALFGSWETNWLAYNMAHDIALPGGMGPKLGFLMYPQAETASLRLDCLDPDKLRYSITSKELAT